MPKVPEFIIHHEAFHLLREAFGEKRVVPEYYLPTQRQIRGGRVDIAIMDEAGEKPVLLIEIKAPLESKRTRRPAQCNRYEQIANVPVVCIRGMRMAKNAVAIARGMMRP